MSSSTGSSSCTECGAGTSVNKQGSACEACNAGKYQHLSAQTACIRCAAGAFTPSHLTTGYTACKACEKGVYLCISACVRACVRACACGLLIR
jgi:syndecan 4